MTTDSRGPTPLARFVVALLFAIVMVVTVWVPFYNRIEPTWYGIPFFYWFQIGWIVVAAGVTVLAYKLRI
jgi:hypothetical protein